MTKGSERGPNMTPEEKTVARMMYHDQGEASARLPRYRGTLANSQNH